MTHLISKGAIAALTLSLGLLTSVAISTGSAAASECKGKTKSACGSAAICSWVDSYKTKTGSKVSAYCRAKGGKKATSKKTTKKSSTKKASAKKAADDKDAVVKKADNKKSTSSKKSESKKSTASKKTKSTSKKKKKPLVKKSTKK